MFVLGTSLRLLDSERSKVGRAVNQMFKRLR